MLKRRCGLVGAAVMISKKVWYCHASSLGLSLCFLKGGCLIMILFHHGLLDLVQWYLLLFFGWAFSSIIQGVRWDWTLNSDLTFYPSQSCMHIGPSSIIPAFPFFKYPLFHPSHYLFHPWRPFPPFITPICYNPFHIAISFMPTFSLPVYMLHSLHPYSHANASLTL